MITLIKTISTFAFLLTLSCALQAESLYTSNPHSRIIDSDADGVIDARDMCSNTLSGAFVDNDGCSTITEERLTIQLKVLFDSGKADLKHAFYPELKKLADFLKANPAATAVIEGHTDSVGSDELNRSLSQQRASAISHILINSFKIDESRVKGVGFGEMNPIATNETAWGREKNRRVVAEVLAKTSFQEARWNVFSIDKNTQTARNNY
ncbi:OmpA family protein [Marinomonas algarum]|uniref:OmpA family protein n=1 Tax=Marinomonas algarum TaxID=2883105 RepID=A0A9X1IM14_9GAMM|nr:OmpA family protein [Marinomonas algarum]MCB5160761.1 OmpA family protein [Marinomonas algarum]